MIQFSVADQRAVTSWVTAITGQSLPFFRLGLKWCSALRRWLVRVNTGLGRNHFVVNKDGHRLLVVTPVEETINEPLQVLVNWR